MCHPEAFGLWVWSTSFLLVRGACCLAMQVNAQSILISDAINLLTRGCADYLILIRWNTGQGQECLSFQGHSLHGMLWYQQTCNRAISQKAFLVQPSLFCSVAAVGKQFMVEKTVWKAEFYFWVYFKVSNPLAKGRWHFNMTYYICIPDVL